MTQNTPGVLEYLSGDPNNPGYRADHGGKNYHDHLAFKDKATTLKVKQALEDAGIQVKGFGDRDGHAENSYHYSDQAIDIPGAQWGGSGPIGEKEFAGSKRVREIARSVLGGTTPTKPSGGGAPAPEAGTDGTVFDDDIPVPSAVPRPIEVPLPSLMAVNPALPSSSALLGNGRARGFDAVNVALDDGGGVERLLALAGLDQRPRNALARPMRTPLDRGDGSEQPAESPFQALLRAY
jgi:hypothetical protein